MQVTWVGHATALVVVDGRALRHRSGAHPALAHLRRHMVADVEALAPDVVLISHLHVDHLHLASLRLLTRDRPAGHRGAGRRRPRSCAGPASPR